MKSVLVGVDHGKASHRVVEFALQQARANPSRMRVTDPIPDRVRSEVGHDLIVVGRTGGSGLRVAISGSTANRLAQHAPVPVVVQ